MTLSAACETSRSAESSSSKTNPSHQRTFSRNVHVQLVEPAANHLVALREPAWTSGSNIAANVLRAPRYRIARLVWKVSRSVRIRLLSTNRKRPTNGTSWWHRAVVAGDAMSMVMEVCPWPSWVTRNKACFSTLLAVQIILFLWYVSCLFYFGQKLKYNFFGFICYPYSFFPQKYILPKSNYIKQFIVLWIEVKILLVEICIIFIDIIFMDIKICYENCD